MKRRALLVGAFAISLAAAVRALLAPLRILTADEAYYLCAARRGPSPWPIDDHPPMLGALLALADRWMPGPIELRVRVVAIALQIVTALGVADLAARLGDDDSLARRGDRWMFGALLATWGVLPMAGGLLATPDAPLLAALSWVLALLARPPSSARDELGLRACVLLLSALAVASKASALPFVLVIAVAHLLRRDGPTRARGAAIALGAALALPLTLTPLHVQLEHALGRGPKVAAPLLGSLPAAGAFVVGQVLLLGPAIVLVVIAVARDARSHRAPAPRLPPGVLLATALVVLAALVSALVSGRPPEPNWTAPALLAIFAVTSVGIERVTRGRRLAVLAVTIAPAVAALALWSLPTSLLPAGRDPLARVPRVERTFSAADAHFEGRYAGPAWRCVYENECLEIDEIFDGWR